MRSHVMRVRRLAHKVLGVLRREGPRGLADKVRRRLALGRRILAATRAASPLLNVETDVSEPIRVGDGTLHRLSGWCFHPSRNIRRMAVLVGDGEHAVLSHGWRADVFGANYRHRDLRGGSLTSGFEAAIPITPADADEFGVVSLSMRVEYADGGTAVVALPPARLAADATDLDGPLLRRPAEGTPLAAICMAVRDPSIEEFRRQIEAIRGQTHADFACLIADDGSGRERAGQIEAAVAGDRRFHVRRSEKPVGADRALEAAFRRVPTDASFVTVADPRGCWSPDTLATLLGGFADGVTLVIGESATAGGRNRDRAAFAVTDDPIAGRPFLVRASLLRTILPFPSAMTEATPEYWIACVAAASGTVRRTSLTCDAPIGSSAVRDPSRIRRTAEELTFRCGATLSAEDRADLDRLCRLERSPAAGLWLAARAVSTRSRADAELAAGLLGAHSTTLRQAVRRRKISAKAALGGRVRSLFRVAMPTAAQGDPHMPWVPGTNELTADQAAAILDACPQQPFVSVVVPVYRVAPKWLELCIKSVVTQHYERWELLLVDDCSGRPELTALMEAWARRDGRIRPISLPKNLGISGSTNEGIAAARGEFVAFLDHDDELTPDALAWFVKARNDHPDAVWFYSDEDIVATDGTCLNAHFKPDFSPEFLLAVMYTCHLSVYSAELLRSVGGLRRGFEGSQDHDLALRLSERVRREQVVHIPRVLYHWRAIPTSTASGSSAKPYAAVVGRRAVEEALHRRGIKGYATSDPLVWTMYRLHLQPRSTPRVTIVIPTRNAVEDVRTCVESLHRKTWYPDYEVVVIDNGSDDPELFKYFDEATRTDQLRVVKYDKPFNHSAMNNEVVRSCKSEFVVFMNNDVELLSDGWLETLVATAQMDDSVAGVGAKLLYPDRSVQHAGIIFGVCGKAGHAHRFYNEDDFGYLGRLRLLNEFTGATAALLLMRRSAFLEVGGFDETQFPTSYNDVDLWLRLQQAGYRCLYNPAVKALHYESKSRKESPQEAEYERRIKARWGETLVRDRFHNPNLSLDNEQFRRVRPYPIELPGRPAAEADAANLPFACPTPTDEPDRRDGLAA